MKRFRGFLAAGLVTFVTFALPGFEAPAFAYMMLFGPALLFAIVLIVQASEFTTRLEKIVIFLFCGLSYWSGEFLFSLQRNNYTAQFRLFEILAPALAAFVLLGSIGLLRLRFEYLPHRVHQLTIGTLTSFISGVPLVLSQFFIVSAYPAWGAHILIWYLAVGPCALAILRHFPAKNEKEEPNQSPEATPGDRLSGIQPR